MIMFLISNISIINDQQVLVVHEFNWKENIVITTAQKMKFSIKDFFSKCDQNRRKLRIWSHLWKKSLMENFTICAMIKL